MERTSLTRFFSFAVSLLSCGNIASMNTMNQIIIQNVSKDYELTRSRASTLKELFLRDIFQRTEKQTIHALNDISFSVEEGKTLGIIGGNGSGKSTLLRLIAGITEPTCGMIKVEGRVASILDLGVGFHPELSGLDNIFLQAAVLGIDRKTIEQRLDAIIDFAELRAFIYMPLKYYSSGMTLRLGFSIAVNVNPDILLIDEVLSVGDVGFQKKSLEKIKSFKQRNKTIVFVTHDLDQAEMLCDEVIWIEKGCIRSTGEPDKVVNSYVLHANRLHREIPLTSFRYEHCVISDMGRYGSGDVTIEEVIIRGENGQPTRHLRAGEPITVEIQYVCNKPVKAFDCQVGIGRVDGAHVSLNCSAHEGMPVFPRGERGTILATFQPAFFQAGKYLLSLELCPPDEPLNPFDMQLRMYTFIIREPGEEVEAVRPAVRLPALVSVE